MLCQAASAFHTTKASRMNPMTGSSSNMGCRAPVAMLMVYVTYTVQCVALKGQHYSQWKRILVDRKQIGHHKRQTSTKADCTELRVIL